MEIRKVACVGAGLVGHSWALIFALKGFSVSLHDVNNNILTDAIRSMNSDLEFLAENNLVELDHIRGVLSRVKTTTNLAKAVEAVDYVQESVAERYDVKQSVFKEIDTYAPEHTILASSASGLLMTEIQKATKRPHKCVLVHPWNPPMLMPLVEIAGGKETSNETIQIAYNLMLKLGKVPVILRKELPGHIANRIQAAVLREAIDLVDKGIATVEDVDRAISAGPGLRWAIMGPFLIHHLGSKGIEGFFESLGPSYVHRWKSMATWTSIPPPAIKKVVKGVHEIELVQSKTMEEIVKWSHYRLAELLKVLGYTTGKTKKKSLHAKRSLSPSERRRNFQRTE